jgi:hypothetical protein
MRGYTLEIQRQGKYAGLKLDLKNAKFQLSRDGLDELRWILLVTLAEYKKLRIAEFRESGMTNARELFDEKLVGDEFLLDPDGAYVERIYFDQADELKEQVRALLRVPGMTRTRKQG